MQLIFSNSMCIDYLSIWVPSFASCWKGSWILHTLARTDFSHMPHLIRLIYFIPSSTDTYIVSRHYIWIWTCIKHNPSTFFDCYGMIIQSSWQGDLGIQFLITTIISDQCWDLTLDNIKKMLVVPMKIMYHYFTDYVSLFINKWIYIHIFLPSQLPTK